MAKTEENPFSGQCAGSELQVWKPKDWGAGEYAQPSTTDSNALSQYWDYENWLWVEDMRISAPSNYSEILGSVSLSSVVLGCRGFWQEVNGYMI